jgi:hypothetical protein
MKKKKKKDLLKFEKLVINREITYINRNSKKNSKFLKLQDRKINEILKNKKYSEDKSLEFWKINIFENLIHFLRIKIFKKIQTLNVFQIAKSNKHFKFRTGIIV